MTSAAMSVLYVEDYAIAAALVRDTLRRRAPEIHLDIVATVAQALACLERDERQRPEQPMSGSRPYDLVLTDLNLPDGLGLEILEHVRRRELPLAVVILTGSGQEDTAIGALRAGANDYVTKRDDYLSLLPATLHAALVRFRADAAQRSRRLNVLYADADEVDIERVRKELDRRAPHILVRAVHSASELLTRLRSSLHDPPDVVLLDDRLPGPPVIELMKQAVAITGQEIPFVLVTAQGNEQLAQLAIRLGMADYLNKSDGYLERLPFALESAQLKAASVRERTALRKSENEFRTLADNLPDIVIRFDREGRHLYVSPVIESVTGLSPARYIGRTDADIHPPNALQLHFGTTLSAVLSDGQQRRTEFEAATVSGQRWFDAVVAPEFDAAGHLETVLLIARDITERKRAEAEVRASGQLARSTVDALSAQVAILDADGTLVAVNEAWRRFARENDAEPGRVLEGANYLQACDAPGAGCHEGRSVSDGIRAVIRGEIAEFAQEYACHSPTEQRWFTARVTPFAGEPPTRVVVAHENITKRKVAEARVAHYRDHLEEQVALRTGQLASVNSDLVEARNAADAANRAKSEFLSHMSHEIRTPTSSIIGLAGMLRDGLTDGVNLGHLDRLQMAADHLLQIVNDVLDLSKIEAGQMDLEELPFEPRQALSHAVGLLQQRASDKGLELCVEIDPSLEETLVGDALRLEQILINFLGNAIKFTSRGGVRLRAMRQDGDAREVTVRFEVEDSGIGMDIAQQARLFASFAQGDRSIAREFGGTGLGLVIARRLAEAMHGEVGVRSVAGVGSTFWATARFRCATVDGAIDSSVKPPPVDACSTLRGLAALVADDDPTNQMITAHALTRLGLVVDTADNGLRAVQRAQQKRYAVVLMDMHMPLMDGLEATRRLRLLHDRRALPILALTATVFPEDKQQCLEAGMNDHLIKPIQMDQLAAMLLRYLAPI